MSRRPRKPGAKISLGSTLTHTRLQRCEEAQRLLSQCLPIASVYAKLMEKFQIRRQSAEMIVRDARALWAEQRETDREALLDETVNTYKRFYNHAMAKEAHGPARAALRDLSILQGINPEVNAHARLADAASDAAAALDPDRIRARIAELAVKHAKPKDET